MLFVGPDAEETRKLAQAWSDYVNGEDGDAHGLCINTDTEKLLEQFAEQYGG